ncbi:MAG: glycosyltransferase family 4 protein [Myxococcota bacterium]
MKILVDGRVLMHSTVSGVERYTDLLLRHLSSIPNLDIDVIKPPSQSRLSQHIWEHFCLPFKSLEYDLLFCPANIAPVWIPEGVRLVVTLHSVAYLATSNSYSKMFKEYYKRLIPHIIEIADHIVTVSHSERERILHFYPQVADKISVIYSGIDESFFSENVDRENYILSVISYLSAKNMNELIDAFNLIKDKINYNLKIVVSNPQKARNSSFRLSDRITLYYNLDDKLLIDMYWKASLMVQPSRYESFCFPVLEALAASTPVVCTPLDSVREIAGDAVFFSSGFDKESIAHSIFSVLTNPNIRENLKRNRDDVVKRFNWDKTADEYVNLFKKVILTNEG